MSTANKYFSATILCLLCSGCTLSDNVWWTSVAEPIHYPSYWDDKCQQKRFRQMARVALEESRSLTRAELDDYVGEPFTVDQEQGFEDGFVDYLLAGGTGQPPPLPPRRYWKAKFQTPQGRLTVQDWFRGYEHGAAVAESSGYRNLVTVPASDFLKSDLEPYYFGQDSRDRTEEHTVDEFTRLDLPDDTSQRSPAATPLPFHVDNDVVSLTEHEASNRAD